MESVPVRVVGVGSPHGDDAVGWEVVRRLRERLDGKTNAEFITVDGQRLLDVFYGQGKLILVDALAGGDSVGNVQRLEWPDTRIEALAPGSTHALRPGEALELADALGLLPSRVVIYGISTTTMEPGDGLSPLAAAGVEVAIHRIEEELAATPDAAVVRDNHA